MIAVVHQDTYLFYGTVEENLRLGKPDADRRRDRSRGARRQCARVHLAVAAGLRHDDRRARGHAVRRPAPAPGDRPRLAARRADPDPRRGALLGRRGKRGGDPAGDRPPVGRTHDPDPRAPAVERDRRRPHPGARPGPHRRDRPARRADPPRRPLSPADGSAGRRARGRGRPRRRRPRRARARRPRGNRGSGETATDAMAERCRFGRLGRHARHPGADHQAVAPAFRDRRDLRDRAGRRVHRGRRLRRARRRRGQDRLALRLSADPARAGSAARRAAALARILARARHRLSAPGGDADRPVPQARHLGAGLSGAAPLGRSGRARQPGHRDDRVFLCPHRGAGSGCGPGALDGAR